MKIIISDILGRRIITFVKENLQSGWHSIKWNGKDKSGIAVSSGLYLFRFEAGDFVSVKKGLLLK